MPNISNTSKVLKGISSQTIVTLVLGILEIVSFSIMSRLLSPVDFGYYAAIQAIVCIFLPLADAGIGSAIVQRKHIDAHFVNCAFSLSIMMGLFAAILLFSLAKPLSIIVLDDTLGKPLLLMSITLVFNCLSSVNNSILHKRLQFFKMGLIGLVSLIITTIVAVILAMNGYGFYAILTKAFLGSFINMILSYYMAHTKYLFVFDIKQYKSIFNFSGWLMISAFFRNFSQQIDRLLMGRLLSVTELGTYNRPKEFITQVSSRLNGIFDSALFPVLSDIQDSKVQLNNAFKSSLYSLNIFSMLLSLAFIFNNEIIIRIFMGEQWLPVKSVFMILSIALIFNVDGRLTDCFFRSLGLTKQQFIFRMIELVVKIAGLFIGACWGVIGVAWAVLITNIAMVWVKLLFLSNRLNVYMRDIVIILFSSWRFILFLVPFMLLPFTLCPHSWFGNIITAIVFSLLVMIIFINLHRCLGTQYDTIVYPRIKSIICKVIPVIRKVRE